MQTSIISPREAAAVRSGPERQTRVVINQNFLFGILFIIGGLIGASYGVINPIVAAMLHNAGSLIVVYNSARLVRQGEELGSFEPGATSASTDDPAGMAPQPA